MTSSLFATTVAASFLVVALPHLLPCPVPATKYADGEIVVDENGKRKRWRRRQAPDEQNDGFVRFNQGAEAGEDQRGRRECPVPKPGGLLGEWLGFHKSSGSDASKKTDGTDS